jgi:hypothetical protein
MVLRSLRLSALFVALVLALTLTPILGATDSKYKPPRPAGGPPSYSNKYKKSAEALPSTKEEAMDFAESFMGTQKWWKAIKIYKQILVRSSMSCTRSFVCVLPTRLVRLQSTFPDIVSNPSDAATVYNHLAIAYAQDKYVRLRYVRGVAWRSAVWR